jgi:hypothetical protein
VGFASTISCPMIFVGSDYQALPCWVVLLWGQEAVLKGSCPLQQGCQAVGAVTFINVDLSTSSNNATARSFYFEEGEQHGSLPWMALLLHLSQRSILLWYPWTAHYLTLQRCPTHPGSRATDWGFSRSMVLPPCLCSRRWGRGSSSWENVRQYTTFDATVFSVKYPWMGISSLSCVLLDEVAAAAWHETSRGWVRGQSISLWSVSLCSSIRAFHELDYLIGQFPM